MTHYTAVVDRVTFGVLKGKDWAMELALTGILKCTHAEGIATLNMSRKNIRQGTQHLRCICDKPWIFGT